MALTSLLFSFLLLALVVAANPVVINRSLITLPLTRKFNSTSAHKLLKHDQARAQALKNRASGRNGVPATVISEPVENNGVTYVTAVGVGSPPTTYSLLVDTGSSNTWVGAGKAYVRTSTSVQTINKVSVSYGSGSFSGDEFIDTVTIASPDLVISQQSIGVASRSSGFDGVDGILGIGPVDLTTDTLSPEFFLDIPTVTDNLRSRGNNEIGIFFEPYTEESARNGQITWGGIDSSKFTGPISYTPITTTSPANKFWGINQSIRYGASTTILISTAGIVDTGTTLILLASDAFSRYQSATDAVIDGTTGLLRITSAQFANLQSLFFTTNGVTYELTANAQIWPRSLNTDIGGVAGDIYLIVSDIGSPSGEGLDFINGYAFLERFYSVYDTANRRVGFATTSFTTADTN